MISGTWPEEGSSPVFIRGYGGRKYEELIEAYHRDAVLLLAQGYGPPARTTSRGSGASHGGGWPSCSRRS